MSRTDPLCPIAHAACLARQRRMVQFIGSLTFEPAGYHGRAHLQRRLYLVPSMYNISMDIARRARTPVIEGKGRDHAGIAEERRRRTPLVRLMHFVTRSNKVIIRKLIMR